MDMMVSEWEPAAAGVEYDGTANTDDCRATLRAYLTANYESLHRRLMQYLGCPDQASDSLHDAWLRLGEMALPAMVGYPEAYIYRIACNLAIDRLRHDRGNMSLDELPEQAGLVDPWPGPAQVAEARSELAALERSLSRLPFRHQAVLFDLRIEEYSRAEVARRFGLSLRRIDTVLRQSLDCCAAQRVRPGGVPVAATVQVR